MLVRDLHEDVRLRIAKLRFDRMIEKHEGPWDWQWWLKEAEFFEVEGRFLLLPLPAGDLKNVKVVRLVLSKDEQTLILYHLDSTHDQEEMFAGRVAICERFPETEFYVATFYHEWYTIPFLADGKAG
jgi:hypothetical protein